MIGNGLLLPIAAPSGTGKTTVCGELLKSDICFEFSVSCTTRKPRGAEIDGIEYHFVTKETFEKYIIENKLVEWEMVFENYYGTLKSTLQEAIDLKKNLLLDIDVKGALNIKKMFPDNTTTVFLLPPTNEELIKRLRKRGTEDEETIQKRLARLPEELQISDQFDYRIINNKLNETTEKILKIIKEGKK